jgi:hypothetical protein
LPLKIREKKDCRWDLVSLGEVMVRFDPGDRRIATARTFEVCEGGGEYNVARGLKRCFGLDTAIVTAFADDPVGKLLQDLLYQGGVDQTYVKWLPHDGVGRSARNGLNFTERGFGVRAAAGSYDRGHTAVSHLKPGDFDWDEIFGKYGARWLHTGGIFCALSDTTPKVALEAMQAARKHGVIVSYDLNYRASLWKTLAGSMSGGEQQMLALARALMLAPRILLIDEPSVGLAPLLVARTIDAIKQLKDHYQLTVLMAEQNFKQAVRIADRGYVIVHGKIAFEGRSADELNNNDLVRKLYMGI